MKKFFLLISMMLMGVTIGTAQIRLFPDVPNMKGKWITGGNLGLGMVGRTLYFSIAPQLGYRVTNAWEVGVRTIYDLDCNFDRYNGNTTLHHFGLAGYTSLQVYKGFFIHAEDEMMYRIARFNHQTVDAEKWFNSIFVGAGYRSYYSSNTYAYIMVLYNLSWGVIPETSNVWDTPYSNPISFRVGYCFGFPNKK